MATSLLRLSSYPHQAEILLRIGPNAVIREIARQGILPYPAIWVSTRPFGTPLVPVLLKWLLTVIVIIAPPAGDAFAFLVDLQSYPANRVFHSWDFGPTWAPTWASNLAQVGTQVGAQNRSWMSSRAQELDLTSKLANLGPNLELQLRLTAPVSHQSGYLTLQLGPPTWPILDQVEDQVGTQVGPKKPTVKHPNVFSFATAVAVFILRRRRKREGLPRHEYHAWNIALMIHLHLPRQRLPPRHAVVPSRRRALRWRRQLLVRGYKLVKETVVLPDGSAYNHLMKVFY
ncbi:hypothetical protein B0H13DRAFT_2268286 [Mycena leptocephala]|nr:hypothetical protein B0H13DRAFT_2268286 [Mycena leptocephala]